MKVIQIEREKIAAAEDLNVHVEGDIEKKLKNLVVKYDYYGKSFIAKYHY